MASATAVAVRTADELEAVHERFQKLERLGQGAFGEVRAGLDTWTGSKVALKYVSVNKNSGESSVSRAVFREIQSLLLLQDNNHIVRLISYFPDEASVCLVFEYLDSDLAEVIQQSPSSLRISDVKAYAHMILTALNHCHQCGIVHRDVKPSNILLSLDGVVKLADFGLARLITDKSMSHQVSTRIYRAPELLFAARHYDAAVDIWSCGAVVAEMFLLKPLFNGSNDIDQIFRVFQVMGSPNTTTWPGVVDLPDFSKVKFPDMLPLDFRELFPRLCSDDIEFIHQMLKLNPSHRMSAADLLKHSYFTTFPLPTGCHLLSVPRRQRKRKEALKLGKGLSEAEKLVRQLIK